VSTYKVNDVVEAVTTITESGNDNVGDPKAIYPQPQYIHAVAGDIGFVEYVDEDGYPMVRFDRTGTATTLDPSDIKEHVCPPAEA
jgi:hypothetical protein